MGKQIAVLVLMTVVLWSGWKREQRLREAVRQQEELIRLFLFLAEEICGRATVLEQVFSQAAIYCSGRAAVLAGEMARQLYDAAEPAGMWKKLVRDMYRQLFFTEAEYQVIENAIHSCLLPTRQAIREQLSLDQKRLEEFCRERKTRLTDEVRLCRGVSFCGAFFLLIAVW